MNRRSIRKAVLFVVAALLAPACGPATGPGAADPAGTSAATADSSATMADSSAVPAADGGAGHATTASAGGWSVRVVRIEIERQPDGERYPNHVKESYTLEPDGLLRYSAYFGGMPIEMNHMDGVDWPVGEAGRGVLVALDSIVADPARFAELIPVPDDGPEPACPLPCYHLGLSREDGDFTFFVGDDASQAFVALDTAFDALVESFEGATGRPLTPGDLPQR